jgi:hypothetical protein
MGGFSTVIESSIIVLLGSFIFSTFMKDLKWLSSVELRGEVGSNWYACMNAYRLDSAIIISLFNNDPRYSIKT